MHCTLISIFLFPGKYKKKKERERGKKELKEKKSEVIASREKEPCDAVGYSVPITWLFLRLLLRVTLLLQLLLRRTSLTFPLLHLLPLVPVCFLDSLFFIIFSSFLVSSFPIQLGIRFSQSYDDS